MYNFNSVITVLFYIILILKEGGCVMFVEVKGILGSLLDRLLNSFNKSFDIIKYNAQPDLSGLIWLRKG